MSQREAEMHRFLVVSFLVCVGCSGGGSTTPTGGCSVHTQTDLVEICALHGRDALPTNESSTEPPCTFTPEQCAEDGPLFSCIAGGSGDCYILCFHEGVEAGAFDTADVYDECGTGA